MRPRWLTLLSIAFFALMLAAGLLTYREYGIATDEPAQIEIGRVNYNYVTRGDPALLTFRDRYYGPFTELILYSLTAHLPPAAMIHARHLLIFLEFYVGSVVFFLLARRLLRSSGWGLLATAMLVASPRIWANAFYNSKDIPLLVMFIFAFYTLTLLLDALQNGARKPKLLLLVVLHSLTTAIAIDHRVLAVMLIVLTILLLLALAARRVVSWRKTAAILTGYLVLSAAATILFCPVLWHAPLQEFMAAFRLMSQYPLEIPVLYRAQFYSPQSLPPDYLPRWIAISTPISFLIGSALGSLMVAALPLRGLRAHASRTPAAADGQENLRWYAVAVWAFGPLLILMLLHVTLYDSWRHVFFVYPALVLLSGFGFKTITDRLLPRLGAVARNACLRRAVGLLLVAALFFDPVRFLSRYPTGGYVYFNALAGKPGEILERYDMDYWALSYKQGIDYIAASDPAAQIKIYASLNSAENYIRYLLPEQDAIRFQTVDDIDDADYFITEYRLRNQKYNKYKRDRVYGLTVDGNEIMTVFKFKP